MKKLLESYCNNGKSNGLLLVDMPTGTGKTYSVIEYMRDAITKYGEERKYFFITTEKKNLPIEQAKEIFDKEGKLDIFKEKFLFVDSNLDSVINGWQEALPKIPDSIKERGEYIELANEMKWIKETANKKNGNNSTLLDKMKQRVREQVEPDFRGMIYRLLKKQFRNAKERLNAIKNNPKWSWIAILYPVVFIKERQIVFMSVDKFLSRITTLIEPSELLYNSSMLDNSIIFIDEIDESKETILANIVNNGLRDKINYIELFNNIYSRLRTHTFPAKLTTVCQSQLEKDVPADWLEGTIQQITDKAEKIYKKYSLEYSFKTDKTIDDSINNFLFQDYRYMSISDDNSPHIALNTDKEQKENKIKFTDKKVENKTSIPAMLGEIYAFIEYFKAIAWSLATNYQQCKNEIKDIEEDKYSLESAVRSVLEQFEIKSEYINCLTSQILMNSAKYRHRIPDRKFDLSFYQKGFRYYVFEDNPNYDMESKIMMCAFDMTPEKLLLHICEKAKVVGISATATLNTAIGNYDLRYLKLHLQDKYYVLSKEERVRLSENFKKSVKGYDKVNIHTEIVEGEKYDFEVWRKVFDSDAEIKHIMDMLDRDLADEETDYYHQRYFRIAFVFKQFLLHEDIKSFLCLLTKHPKREDAKLDRNILDEIFELIVQTSHQDFDVQKQVVQLDGERYEEKKKDISARLAAGEKLFVLSVYRTLGAGQNLQYPIPEDMQEGLVKINDRVAGKEKDFDGIYLDKPTNILINPNSDLDMRQLVKYIFQLEMLLEFGELAPDDTLYYIREAFRRLVSQKGGKAFGKIYDAQSVSGVVTRIIIQAIGRICRTNMKSKNIYIYADSKLANVIDFNVVKWQDLNYEFVSLLEKLRDYQGDREKVIVDLEKRETYRANRVKDYIYKMMPNKYYDEQWTSSSMEKWKDLRNMVLTHPTASSEFASNNVIVNNFYTRLGNKAAKLYYSETGDYNEIQVFFDKMGQRLKCVSGQDAKLDMLMRIDFVRQSFEEQGFATQYQPNDYIMSPVLHNNIYKGALGEVAGKIIFDKCIGVQLEEIDDNDIFEFFDYRVAHSDIYVDFKNWHASSKFSAKQQIKHISDKAKKCNAKCVIIANIIEEEYRIRSQSMDGIPLYIVPRLVNQEDIANKTKPSINQEAIEKIRRIVDEYSNKD